MVLIVLVALIVVPLVEIAVFIKVGGIIGLGPTLVVVIATAILGTALLRHQGLSTLARARESLARNEMPVAEVFDGVCLLAAGLVLLTPGFVTDAIGGLLFIPPIRRWLGGVLLRRVMASGGVWVDGERVHPSRSGPVIEGEAHEIQEIPDEPDDLPRR